MNLLPLWTPLRNFVSWAWERVLGSVRLRRAGDPIVPILQTLPPAMEGVLISQPPASDAAWLSELESKTAAALGLATVPRLTPEAAAQLLQWRREHDARFTNGDWLAELMAAVQPGQLDSASIEEQGLQPRQHLVSLHSGIPPAAAQRPSDVS